MWQKQKIQIFLPFSMSVCLICTSVLVPYSAKVADIANILHTQTIHIATYLLPYYSVLYMHSYLLNCHQKKGEKIWDILRTAKNGVNNCTQKKNLNQFVSMLKSPLNYKKEQMIDSIRVFTTQCIIRLLYSTFGPKSFTFAFTYVELP